MDTIFALATAQGRAGVAIVRISGVHAIEAVSDLCRVTTPTKRGLRALYDTHGVLLDKALVLRFAEGFSFTGEEIVELHLHGSPAVVASVLRVLGDDPRLRLAEAGEFTRRALENGQLDLAQVEGLADLIDAETESQRRQALRVFSGALGEKAANWRASLVRATALLEATIDFADEDVPVDVSPEVVQLIEKVQADMHTEVRGVLIAERIRDGFEVAIIGPPNAGKSTLLNYLAGREAAITSEVAGTTRDVIEVRMDLGGLPVVLLDTAGLRETDDVVEQIGVQRAKDRAATADLRVYLNDGMSKPMIEFENDDIVLMAKSDLGDGKACGVSGKTGAGVDELIEQIIEVLGQRAGNVGVAMRERHRVAMLHSVEHMKVALSGLSDGGLPTDLIAEELRVALRAVDSLIGRVDVEHVLDEIFMSFCIGK